MYFQSSIFPLICANLPPKNDYRETVLQVQAMLILMWLKFINTMMLIASAKSWSVRGASHQPAFMGSCLTISHICLPRLPGGGWANPCVLWPLVIELMVVLLTFFFMVGMVLLMECWCYSREGQNNVVLLQGGKMYARFRYRDLILVIYCVRY